MKKLPQNIFAFLVLVGALVVIMLVQRPHTPCDSQSEIFKVNQTTFLYLDPKKPYSKKIDFLRVVDFCKQSNSPGGCLEFFEGMKRLYSDLDKVKSDCTASLVQLSEVREAIFTGLELMVRLAWGERAPVSNLDRSGWLDASQVSVFCDFKKLVIRHIGTDSWSAFIEKEMAALPGASLLPRNDVWSRTLLSDPCVY